MCVVVVIFYVHEFSILTFFTKQEISILQLNLL